MEPSSTVFNNTYIETAKRSIKCDACIFLALYCIAFVIGFLSQSPDYFFYMITFFAPYLVTAILGFLTSSNEHSCTNCYNCYLKLTLILVAIDMVKEIYWLFYVLGNCTRNCGGYIIGALLGVAYASFAMVIWNFANKHINNLKDLMSRGQDFQNPGRTVILANKNQFNPSTVIEVGNTVIEVGRQPQSIPQNYHQQIPQTYAQQTFQNYPQQIPQNYPQNMPQNYSQNIPQNYPQGMPQNYPQNKGQNSYNYNPVTNDSIEMT